MKRFILCSSLTIFCFFGLQAQIDSSLRSKDSCRIYLNKIENTGSMRLQLGTVYADGLNAGYSPNILSSLTGKVSGLDVKTASTGNSASTVFFMKGQRNLQTSNQPLFVVDGVPIAGEFLSALGLDYGNLVNDWNLDDVESVTVLKSGQAAALYGNLAGNGAVIINTKRADERGFHVDYNSAAMIRGIADYPEFQNEYGQGWAGLFSYEDGEGGGLNDGGDCSWGPKFEGQLISQFDGPSTGWIDGQAVEVRGGDVWARRQAALNGIDNSIEPTPWVSRPDNMKDYFQTAFLLSNNLGISWADKNGGIRVSYTNTRANDVTPCSRFTKNSLNGNASYTFFKRINVYGSFLSTKMMDENVIIQDYEESGSPMEFFAWMGRQVNVNSLKNYWQAGRSDSTQYNYNDTYWDNPWFRDKERVSDVGRTNLFGTLGAKISITRRFSLNYVLGSYDIDANGKHVVPPASVDITCEKNEASGLSGTRHSVFADWNFRLGKANFFDFFLGWYSYNTKSSLNEREMLNGHDWLLEYNTTDKKHGCYGGVSFSCKEALHLRLTMTRDNDDLWSDEQHQALPVYYAASTGADVEKILRLPEVVSRFSIQTGYSRTGLNGTFQYSFINGERMNVPVISEYTISAELGLFSNRVTASFNGYSSRTINIDNLMGIYATAFDDAAMKNSGVEIGLDVIPVRLRKVTWESSVAFFRNKNILQDFREGCYFYVTNPITLGCAGGQSYGDIYGTAFNRYNGKIVFERGYATKASVQSLGNVNPDYMIFWNNSVRINKVTITAGIEYSKGGSYYSSFYLWGTYAGTLSHTADRETGVVGDGVMWDDATGKYVANTANVKAQGYYCGVSREIDEYSIMDATYLRLQEISVSYPFKIKNLLSLTCSLFGQNLLTLSKNKDYDNSTLYLFNNVYYRGINNYNLPDKYTLGVKIKVHI